MNPSAPALSAMRLTPASNAPLMTSAHASGCCGAPRRSLAQRVLALSLAALMLAQPPLLYAATSDNLPNLGDSSSEELSPLTERKLGEEIMRQAHEDGDVFEDPDATEYLNQFGANLIAHAPVTASGFEFFLVKDPQINAFALPGGFIGVNSGLILSAQSESELASVMSHEMGHVVQRHIARQLGRQSQGSMVALGALLLAVLAARAGGGGDITQAAALGGQAYAIQDQLNFSRDSEREADRVGFQILSDANFDPSAMVSFFGRMQTATRLYEGAHAAPSWLRTHPMTTERMADMQNRIRTLPYHQRPDSAEFNMLRARLRVLQDDSQQGLRDARDAFQGQIKTGTYTSELGVRYGLALVDMLLNDLPGARAEYARTSKIAKTPSAMLDKLGIEIEEQGGDRKHAVELASAARARYPQSRMLAAVYARTLQGAGRDEEAVSFLRDQISLYRSEALLYELLAKSYATRGEAMLEHRYLAEAYYLRGSLEPALQQLTIARGVSNGDFYELSQIDARIHEIQARVLEQRKAKKESGKELAARLAAWSE